MASFKAAHHALSTAQKGSKGVSLYSRWINRPLGRVLAAAAYRAGLSPNAVTACSAACTVGALAALVGLASLWWSGLIVAPLLVLGFALDSADGQLARLTGRSSPAGEWLDHMVDAAKMVLVHACVLVGLWLGGQVSVAWLLVPLGYQLVAVVMFSGGTTVELLARQEGVARAPAAPSQVRAVALLPADYGVLAWCTVLWGLPAAFLGMYAALFVLNAAILMALLLKWFRSLGTLAKPRPGLLPD